MKPWPLEATLHDDGQWVHLTWDGLGEGETSRYGLHATDTGVIFVDEEPDNRITVSFESLKQFLRLAEERQAAREGCTIEGEGTWWVKKD